MTLPILKFLAEHSNINKIIQKFGTAGHSPVQEDDNLHSQIEKKMTTNEVFSPVSFIKLLKAVNAKNPITTVQMLSFTNYHSQARHLNCSNLPFAQLKEIIYEHQNLNHLQKIAFL